MKSAVRGKRQISGLGGCADAALQIRAKTALEEEIQRPRNFINIIYGYAIGRENDRVVGQIF